MTNKIETTEQEKPTDLAGRLDVLVIPDISTVTGEQVKEAMIDREITRVDHHECGICGFMVYFSRDGEQLYFNSRCDCVGVADPEPRSWEHAADWINMQSNHEVKNKLAKRFGLL